MSLSLGRLRRRRVVVVVSSCLVFVCYVLNSAFRLAQILTVCDANLTAKQKRACKIILVFIEAAGRHRSLRYWSEASVRQVVACITVCVMCHVVLMSRIDARCNEY